MVTRLDATREAAASDWEVALEKWARPSPLVERRGGGVSNFCLRLTEWKRGEIMRVKWKN